MTDPTPYTRLSRTLLLNLAFGPALLFNAPPLLAGETVDETRDVGANEIIDIELINGEVTVTGWDRNQVQVKGELSDQAEGYTFSSSNGITRFEEEYEDRRGFFGRNCDNWFNCRGEVDPTVLEIFVPVNSTVRLEGVNVELAISNIDGNTEIEIVNGPIEAAGLGGRISLETVNGSIETENLDGRINLSTVNGRIRDRDSNGDRVKFNAVNGSVYSNTASSRVSAESVSGAIELELGSIDDLEASTVSGRIRVSLALRDGGQVEMSSVSGTTELLVDPGISARFDINTAVGGDIDNELTDHAPVRENRFVNSSELQFSLNGGTGNVDISTVTGNILIAPK